MGGEVLGLVHDHVLPRDGATADVADRLHLQQTHPFEVRPVAAGSAVGPRTVRRTRCPFRSRATLLLGAVAEQEIKVVDDRLHPGAHLFLEASRQEANLFAERNHRPGHQQPLIELLIRHLVQAGRQGQQGFAGTGLPHQGQQLHRGVQQQIQGKGLLTVSGSDLAQSGARAALQGHQPLTLGLKPRQERVVRLGLIHQGHPLIGLELGTRCGGKRSQR